MKFRLCALWLCCCLAGHAQGRQHLVLIGGGTRPAAALGRLVEWAGGARARVLVVAWATEQPAATLRQLQQDFAPFHPASLRLAARPSSDRARFLQQLANADAVFFTGGDQGKITKVLQDRELLEALLHRYQDGVVFGGTSAGTAVMSQQMLTGVGDPTRIAAESQRLVPGLGLLPAGLILDQHFVKRQRENRLFSVLLAHPELRGVGIDEGTALLVTDGHLGEVVGSTQALVIDRRPDGFRVQLKGPGDRFELQSR